ncbi:MAG: hypothetical protein KDB53_17460, partial [Planctomycetes bacterium]|nr:hypothetical protein [Planctomycetota bacterium]
MAKSVLRAKSAAPEDLKTPLLILPCFDSGLGKAAKRVDRALNGLLKRMWDRGEFEGKRDELVLQDGGGDAPFDRVGLLGLGAKDAFDAQCLRRAGAVLAGRLLAKNPGATCVFDDLPAKPAADEAAQSLAEGFELARYRFDEFRVAKKGDKAAQLTITDARESQRAALSRGLKVGQTIARGV